VKIGCFQHDRFRADCGDCRNMDGTTDQLEKAVAERMTPELREAAESWEGEARAKAAQQCDQRLMCDP
jgi:hypothetical protein